MNAASEVLLTDLYQLTMLQACHDQGIEDTAAFEFFVRKLPAARNFLKAAGLEQVLEFLEALRFEADDLDCACKLQEYAGQPRRKRSEGKATWPGRKQVWRCVDGAGHIAGDVLTTVQDTAAGAAWVQPVMRSGKRVAPQPLLRDLRNRAQSELARLPGPLRSLDPVPGYEVTVSAALQTLARQVDERHGGA